MIMKAQKDSSKTRRREILRDYFFNAYLLGMAKQVPSKDAPARRKRTREDRLEGDFFPV